MTISFSIYVGHAKERVYLLDVCFVPNTEISTFPKLAHLILSLLKLFLFIPFHR